MQKKYRRAWITILTPATMSKIYIYDALDDLEKEMEEVAGRWNGKTEKGEEEAQTALDIIEKSKELRELIKYLNE